MSQTDIDAIAATLLTIERLTRYYIENFQDPEVTHTYGVTRASAYDAFCDIFTSFDHNNRMAYKEFEQLIFSETYEDFKRRLNESFIISSIVTLQSPTE
jgi:hypothetical protein